MIDFNSFNAEDYQDSNDFSPVPEGNYTMVCESIEEKETKSGSGTYLNCTFQIIDGEKKGRLVFEMFNITNKSEKAQQIGRQQFASYCKAVNVLKPKTEDDILNIPFTANVAIKRDAEYGDKNVIKKYAPAGTKAAAPAPVAQSNNAVPPWRK